VEREHRGWKIRTTARPVDGAWSAMIEVWQPGQRPHTHSAVILPFTDSFDTAQSAEEVAVSAAERWINHQERRSP